MSKGKAKPNSMDIIANMPFMYILLCADNSYYTGSTWDLSTRLEQHQTGTGSVYTKNRLPIRLPNAEEFDRIKDAYRRERQLHGWLRKKKQALIDGKLEDLKKFSENEE
jgi:putative endonuclease